MNIRSLVGRKSRARSALLLTPALALSLAAGSTLLPSAQAATSSTTGSGEQAPTTPSTYKVPTQAELAAKQAEAAKLAAEVTDRTKAVAEANATLAKLQQQAEDALEKADEAQDAETSAQAEEKAQNQRLAAATALVTNRKDEAGQWASQTYRTGSLSGIEKMMTLLSSRNTDDMAQRMQMLDLVGRWRGSVVDTVEEARAVQADAAARAKAAADAATQAHTEAEAAKATAEAALSQQTTQLMVLNNLLQQSQSAAAQAGSDSTAMAEALAASLMGSANTTSNAIVWTTDPSCPGGDISSYSNGQIPISLLCPIYGTTGQYLRADAAKAFNDMSAAYAAQFGSPICITDSYRTLAAQIAVKAAKPGLAATPGRSNHGWARAVDLCGGIQSFGSPQHTWMDQNAGRFGWCNPNWAKSGGSKPEAWHWQFLVCNS